MHRGHHVVYYNSDTFEEAIQGTGAEFRAALFECTCGHPLFTIELLRMLQERGELVQDTEGRWRQGPTLDWNCLPARVEGVIGERLARLSDAQHDVLRTARWLRRWKSCMGRMRRR